MADKRAPDLASWRPGPTRAALEAFIAESVADVAPEERVAVFDNDGTLWCEKPMYAQLDFFIHELILAAHQRPELETVPEYSALLAGDMAAVADIGLQRVALALVDLFTGMTADEFDARVRGFFERAHHPGQQIPYTRIVYQPMLELLDLMRSNRFSTFIVTGGGTEFVRAVSRDLYGIEPEGVVGTLVGYELHRTNGQVVLARTNSIYGDANEGPAKVTQLQMALGRRPRFAAGNTSGDAEMLEFSMSHDGPTMAMLIDHDDDEREYAYEGTAATFESSEPITDTATRLGWTTVSMRRDWDRIFPAQ